MQIGAEQIASMLPSSYGSLVEASVPDLPEGMFLQILQQMMDTGEQEGIRDLSTDLLEKMMNKAKDQKEDDQIHSFSEEAFAALLKPFVKEGKDLNLFLPKGSFEQVNSQTVTPKMPNMKSYGESSAVDLEALQNVLVRQKEMSSQKNPAANALPKAKTAFEGLIQKIPLQVGSLEVALPKTQTDSSTPLEQQELSTQVKESELNILRKIPQKDQNEASVIHSLKEKMKINASNKNGVEIKQPVSAMETAKFTMHQEQPLTKTEIDMSQQNRIDRMVQTVMARMEYVQTKGSDRLKVKLVPEQLGTVEIQLEMKDGVLHGRLLVENETARSLLQQDLGQLNAQLEEKDIRMARLDVDQSMTFSRDGTGADKRDGQTSSDTFSRHNTGSYGFKKSKDEQQGMNPSGQSNIRPGRIDLLA